MLLYCLILHGNTYNYKDQQLWYIRITLWCSYLHSLCVAQSKVHIILCLDSNVQNYLIIISFYTVYVKQLCFILV